MTQFSETLRKTIAERHNDQRLVAEYLTDYMQSHDIDTELDEKRKHLHRSDRERFEATATAIRNFVRRRPRQAGKKSLTQATVCKWVQGENAPSEEKWLALADYMRLPVWEIDAMINRDLPPETAPKLQAELVSARAEIRELKHDRELLRQALERAERRVAVAEVEVRELTQRVAAVETADAPVGV